MNTLPKAVLYIAGPMTGIPHFNHPAFNAVAAVLRAYGDIVISPVELDSPEMQEAAAASEDGKADENGGLCGESWGQVLGRDIAVIADQASGVVALPGWESSRGARLELTCAMLLGKPIFTFTWQPGCAPQLLVLSNAATAEAIARSLS